MRKKEIKQETKKIKLERVKEGKRHHAMTSSLGIQ